MDVAKAKSLNAAICGSLIIQEDKEQYNRFVWVTPREKLSITIKDICFL